MSVNFSFLQNFGACDILWIPGSYLCKLVVSLFLVA